MESCRRVTKRQLLQAVFVSTEVAPWSKSGGLGDVLEALPVALARRGLACMTVAPFYKPYSGTKALDLAVPVTTNSAISTSIAGSKSVHVARLHVIVDKGVLRVFVDHPFFEVPENGIYSSYTADGGQRDVPAAMDVLCQASLAASILVPAHIDQLRGWTGGPLPSDIKVRLKTTYILSEHFTVFPSEPDHGVALQGQSAEPLAHVWDVQTVFVANDWPTSILPLHLLAIQDPSSHDDELSLFPELRGSTQVATHSRPPVAACQHLAELPDASPADSAWHEALVSLYDVMQESLQTSKVACHFLSLPSQASAESSPTKRACSPKHLRCASLLTCRTPMLTMLPAVCSPASERAKAWPA